MSFQKVNFDSLVKFDSQYSSDLLDKYNEGFEKEFYESRSDPTSKTIVPSSVRCMRRIWFRLRGVSKDSVEVPDSHLDFTAEMGTACHRMIQRRLIKSLGDDWIKVSDYLDEVDIEHEYVLYPGEYETKIELKDLPIHFAVDGIIRIDNRYMLLEIKSSEHNSFVNLSEPKDEHRDQVRCYCTLLKLDCALMIYIDRFDGEMKCYTYPVSDSMKTSMNEYFNEVMDHVESGIAPKGLSINDKWCSPSMCDYYQKCKCYGR